MSLIVGNVYESKDRRDRGRRIKVISIEGRDAVCVPLGEQVGRRQAQTRISLHTLTKRWRCVMFDPPQRSS